MIVSRPVYPGQGFVDDIVMKYLRRPWVSLFLTGLLYLLPGLPASGQPLIPAGFFAGSTADDGEILIQWFEETAGLEDRLQGVRILASREDPRFESLIRYFYAGLENPGTAGREAVLAEFLMEARRHGEREDSWNFPGENRKILEEMTENLRGFRLADLRAALLGLLPGLSPERGRRILVEECRYLQEVLGENRGRLPEELYREAWEAAGAMGKLKDPVLSRAALDLYLDSRSDWLNRVIREAGILPEPAE